MGRRRKWGEGRKRGRASERPHRLPRSQCQWPPGHPTDHADRKTLVYTRTHSVPKGCGAAVPEQVAEPLHRQPGLLEERVGLGVGVRGDGAMLTAAAAWQLPRRGQGQHGTPGTLCRGQPGRPGEHGQLLGPGDPPGGLSLLCSNWGRQ